MSTNAAEVIETDAQLVAEVAELDPELAHRVQRRLRALRLRRVVGADRLQPEEGRHSIWHSFRWPFGQRS
jgi:hypothetical protein